MFQMKYEDISAENSLSMQNEDEIVDFFSYYDSKSKFNKNQWDYFQEPQTLVFKKEDSFFQQNSFNHHNIAESFLNQEDNYFYFNKEDIMENENEVKQLELLYPNLNLFNQKSAWKQESRIINNEFKQSNILVDNQILDVRKISTIQWNKNQKYIQIQYNLNEQCSIEKKFFVKQSCSESSIETIEPSNLSESQSTKNHENSITDQEEFSNVSNENSSINISELSLQHHLDSTHHLNFEYESECSNEFISSNFFIFKESNKQQKTAYLQSSILSESLLQFLTNSSQDAQKTVFSSQQLSNGFACLKNDLNRKKVQQIHEYIFSNMENFLQGQIASNELFSFETIDGFSFTLQVFQQVFPIRDQNNELQGCVVKNHMIIPDSIISEIKSFRTCKQEQEISIKKQEQQQSTTTNIISKEEQLQKEIQNSTSSDQFTKNVKKFLYKFKYISKQRNQKQQKKLQDLYPSKVCKYRSLKQ